MLKLILK